MTTQSTSFNLEAEFAKQSHSAYWEHNPQGFNFQRLEHDSNISLEQIQHRWLAYTSITRKKLEDIIPIRTEPLKASKVYQEQATSRYTIDPNLGRSYRSEIETKFAKELQEESRKLTNTLSLALRTAGLPVTAQNMKTLKQLADAKYQDILLNLIIENQPKFEEVILKRGTILHRYIDNMRNLICEAIITSTEKRELGTEIMFEPYAGCVNPLCGQVGQVVWQNEQGNNESYYCMECHVSYKWETKRIIQEDKYGRRS